LQTARHARVDAILLAIFCAVGANSWFARDKSGFDSALIPVPLIGLFVLILIPLQVLLIAIAMIGFNQEWHVEEERPVGTSEDYGAGAPRDPARARLRKPSDHDVPSVARVARSNTWMMFCAYASMSNWGSALSRAGAASIAARIAIAIARGSKSSRRSPAFWKRASNSAIAGSMNANVSAPSPARAAR